MYENCTVFTEGHVPLGPHLLLLQKAGVRFDAQP